MSGGLNHGPSQAAVFVKIVLGKREVLPVEQVLQSAAIAAEISCIDQKIRPAGCCMLEDHGFRHTPSPQTDRYNALSTVPSTGFEVG